MSTPNYTREQVVALRALRDRLRSAKYNWEIRQLLKNTSTAAGIKQMQLVEWQDEQNDRKNLLHWLVDERAEKPALLLIQEFWARSEPYQRQLMRLLTIPKCYIDSPHQGDCNGEYTVEQLAEGRNCEQLVDMIARFRELYRDIGPEGDDPDMEAEAEAEQEETAEERARTRDCTKRLSRISTPIPRTPTPPSPSHPVVSATGVPTEANFYPLRPSSKKALRQLQVAAAPLVSGSSSGDSSFQIASDLVNVGDPVDVDPNVDVNGEMVDSSPPTLQKPIVTQGGDGAGGNQPSTPPAYVPSSPSPPPAPGAPDSPVWYPPSEPGEEPAPAKRGPQWDEERVQRARESQLVLKLSSSPSAGAIEAGSPQSRNSRKRSRRWRN